MGKFLRPWMLLLVPVLAILGYSRAHSDSLSGTGHVNIMDLGGQAIGIEPGGPYGGVLRVVPAYNTSILSGTYHTTNSDNSTLVKSGGFTMLYQLVIQNTTPDEMNVRVFNEAGAPDCVGDTALLRLNIVAPPNQTVVVPFTAPIYLDTGLSFCVTGQNADDDDTAATPGLNLTYVYQ